MAGSMEDKGLRVGTWLVDKGAASSKIRGRKRCGTGVKSMMEQFEMRLVRGAA
jgi:hypothetical protein